MQYTGTVAMLDQFTTTPERRGQQEPSCNKIAIWRSSESSLFRWTYIHIQDHSKSVVASKSRCWRNADVVEFPKVHYSMHAPWWLHSNETFINRKKMYPFIVILLRQLVRRNSPSQIRWMNLINTAAVSQGIPGRWRNENVTTGELRGRRRGFSML